MSVDVGYFRRWYGNFTVTDNLLVAPSDYSTFSIPAPRDPRLPDGGGYVISDLWDLNPNKAGQVDSYFTLASDYGKQIEHWNGVDLTVNARMQNGLLLQGGMSTGSTTTDNCDVAPKLDNPSQRFCHVETPFLTQVKFLSTYTIPKIDVLISGTFQSIPGPNILATYPAPNVLVAPSLGRPLSGNQQNINVALVEPGTHVRRTVEPDRSAVRQSAPGSQDPNGHQSGPLQCPEREHAPDAEQQLRELAAAAVDSPGPADEDQRPVRLLVSGPRAHNMAGWATW